MTLERKARKRAKNTLLGKRVHDPLDAEIALSGALCARESLFDEAHISSFNH
jgi:hypothetical protein